MSAKTQDLIPVFDFRHGGDCEHLSFKTWSEMGLAWNSYRERCITGTSFKPDMLPRLLADVGRKERVIAIGLHNFAASVVIAV